MQPITPSEAKVQYNEGRTLPDNVVACWNTLILARFDGRSAHVFLTDAILALEAATGEKRDTFNKRGWLDPEGLFRAAGWRVTFDKPGYNESYDAYFIFEAPK